MWMDALLSVPAHDSAKAQIVVSTVVFEKYRSIIQSILTSNDYI